MKTHRSTQSSIIAQNSVELKDELAMHEQKRDWVQVGNGTRHNAKFSDRHPQAAQNVDLTTPKGQDDSERGIGISVHAK
jgi:hypothetical protein